MEVFCKAPDSVELPYSYPYIQPWGNFSNSTIPNVIQYDYANNNIRSDMFFMPRPVRGWGDQVLKWIAAVVWFWTPVPTVIFINNIVWYIFDIFQFNGNPSTDGVKYSMYDNVIAKFFMQSTDLMFGPL
jgi:hypothetical protein